MQLNSPHSSKKQQELSSPKNQNFSQTSFKNLDQKSIFDSANFMKAMNLDDNFKTQKTVRGKDQRIESDFTNDDKKKNDKRNILHQTALRQDDKMLEQLLNDYKTVMKEQQQINFNKELKVSQDNEYIDIEQNDDDINSEVDQKLLNYVNQQDIYNCTPILICCFENDSRLEGKREICLKVLIDNGADVNSFNPQNKWSPIHWCSFYGDKQSVKLLLANKCYSFFPDQYGFYPIDLAGNQIQSENKKYQELVEILLKEMIKLLYRCQQLLNSEKLRVDEQEFLYLQNICNNYEFYLQNPILYTKMLFWSCFCKFEEQVMQIIDYFPKKIFPMFQIKSLNNQNCFHSCCRANSYQMLRIIVQFEITDFSKLNPKKIQTNEQNGSKKKKTLIKISQDNYPYREYFTFKQQEEEDLSKSYIQIQDLYQFLNNQKYPYKQEYLEEVQEFLQFLKNFIKNIKLFTDWVKNKLQELNSNYLINSHYKTFKKSYCSEILLINRQDFYGNTPLHLASLNADQQCIKYLLNKFADPEAQNNEFFRARQLTRDPILKQSFELFMQKVQRGDENKEELQAIYNLKLKFEKNAQLDPISDNTKQNFEKNVKKQQKLVRKSKKQKPTYLRESISQFSPNINTKIKKQNQDSAYQKDFELRMQLESPFINIGKKETIRKILTNKINSQQQIVPIEQNQVEQKNLDKINKQIVRRLKLFSYKIFVPDIVIECDLGYKEGIFQFGAKKKEQKEKSIQIQVNFQINLLKSADFDIYLMNSLSKENVIFIMLKLNDDKLEDLAQEMQMQIKLIDSYDLEPFLKKEKNNFEPFRSSQRQNLAYDHLLKSINLGSLIRSEIVKSCFPMHTAGGIQIIKQCWQKLYFNFLPEPFSSIGDYLLEGKGRNFTSITTLRLYFGEKISFYFAWINFQTCFSLIIAIPGLALQIYIFCSEFSSYLLPYWVVLVTIWSTIQVELWKRKTSEINTRWGCIDQMIQEESQYYKGRIKNRFLGDEEIIISSGVLTKHQQITKKAMHIVIVIIVIAIFFIGSYFIVYLIDLLKQKLKGYHGLVFLLGALQAFAIYILNYLFQKTSQWYADKFENHKYEIEYEKSLIYKNSFFQLINSYLPLIYIIVTTNDYSLEDIFYFLLPLIFIKKIVFIILEFIIPYFILRTEMMFYFDKIKDLIQKQNKQNDQYYMDEIEQFWISKELEKQEQQQIGILKSIPRTILKISQNHSQNLIEPCIDSDAIELNSFRPSFRGTFDFFMDAITDYGYFVLFSAAFPIGPFIGIVMNTFTIQIKLYKIMYITKRTKSERKAGIGEWLNVMEVLSQTGVITNFVLLYFKHQDATLNMFTESGYLMEQKYVLWYFVSLVIGISLIKITVRSLIPDRPQWVNEEIDKINHREQIEEQQKAKKLLKEKESNYESVKEQIKSEQQEYEQKKKFISEKTQKLQQENRTLESSQQFAQSYKKTSQNEIVTEYDMVVQYVLKQRYLQLDNQLLIKRIKQIIEYNHQIFLICQCCSEHLAVIQCIQCKKQQNYCQECFIEEHSQKELQQHQIILLTSQKQISNKLQLQNLNIIIPQKLIKEQQKEIIQFKSAIEQVTLKRNWKKIEYFSFPMSQDTSNSLYKIYEQFYGYYFQSSKLEFRDFVINLNSIIPLKQLSFLEEKSTKIEDKLFLNRIAFSIFKKKKHQIDYKSFERICMNFQKGIIEQSLFIFFDFLDINNDQLITKEEILSMFIISFIQDYSRNKKIINMIEDFFPNNANQRIKKELLLEFQNKLQKSQEFKTFLQCFLQEQN